MKGGEADDVYPFPDLSRAAQEQIDDEPDGEDAVIRLFYVGITRARKRLTVLRAVDETMAVSLPL